VRPAQFHRLPDVSQIVESKFVQQLRDGDRPEFRVLARPFARALRHPLEQGQRFAAPLFEARYFGVGIEFRPGPGQAGSLLAACAAVGYRRCLTRGRQLAD